jgi:hypothetical protein
VDLKNDTVGSLSPDGIRKHPRSGIADSVVQYECRRAHTLPKVRAAGSSNGVEFSATSA